MPKKNAKGTKEIKVWEFTDHHYPIRIYFAPNKKNWHDLLKFLDLVDEPYPDIGGGMVTPFEHPDKPLTMCILTISKAAKKYSATMVMGMIVHECVHLKQFAEVAMYGNNAGKGRGRLDVESEAYFMQQVTQWANTSFADSGRKFAP